MMAPTSPAPLDPQLAAIVAAMRSNHVPPPFSGTPEQARQRMTRAIMTAREKSGVPVVGSVEDSIATYDTLRVPVRIYRPASDRATYPTVVFFHGGGFVLGSVELMDDIARKLCRDVDAVVVSVEYRLAPEHPFPAAHEDAVAATAWTIRNAKELGGDPSLVAVAGESAGANLAASAALVMRDRGLPLAAQLLVAPGVNFARDIDRIEQQRPDHPMLCAADLRDIGRLYLGETQTNAYESPPSPLHAKSFEGLPPTVIALAGHCALRDEGADYAHRLATADVWTKVLQFDDMFHPFFGFFEASASAKRANDVICAAFAACLGRG